MLLIYGRKWVVHEVGTTTAKCKSCGHIALHSIYERKLSFSIFFVPIFGMMRRYIAKCQKCNLETALPIEREQLSTLLSESAFFQKCLHEGGVPHNESIVTTVKSRKFFYAPNIFVFLLLSILTLGLYSFYWFYKNWEFFKMRGQAVIPWARSLFFPFYISSFASATYETSKKQEVSPFESPVALLALFWACWVLIGVFPLYAGYFYLASFLIYIPILLAMRKYNHDNRGA